MKTQLELQRQLEYAIKHDPVRYVVKSRWLLFWTVETMDGNQLSDIFIYKVRAQAYCDLFNAIYSLGYTKGCNAIVNVLFNKN